MIMIFLGGIAVVVGMGAILFVLGGSLPRIARQRPPEKTEEGEQQAQHTAVKERILVERMSRRMQDFGARATRKARALTQGTVSGFQQGHRKLRLLAQEFDLRRTGKKAVSSDELLTSAAVAMEEEDLDAAEERFLACLKLDTKDRDAYIGLAALYQRRKEDALAEETLRFLAKLYADDAEVHFLLAEVLRVREQHAAALKEAQIAVRLAPKHPKYIDFAIEEALVVGDAPKARDLVDRLREANPENQKIEEFEQRIEDL